MRRLLGATAALALATAGAVGLMAGGVLADTPNPQDTQTGQAVINGDGSVTVTVTGGWTWTKDACDKYLDGSDLKDLPGWAVSWGDNHENPLDSTPVVYVGDATDNAVHFDANGSGDPIFDPTSATYCGLGGLGTQGTFQHTLSHTYTKAFVDENGLDAITPCVVTYHLTVDALGDDGDHGDQKAGGSDNNGDNSVEKSKSEDQSDGCAPVTISPDVKIEKTGPATATVGTPFSYTLKVTNTSVVDAPSVVVTDVLPASLTFGSATAPCAYDAGTRTVTCSLGTISAGASTSLTLTVTPTAAGSVSNTGVVGPTDGTPNDNTSTWTIANVVVAAEVAFTG